MSKKGGRPLLIVQFLNIAVAICIANHSKKAVALHITVEHLCLVAAASMVLFVNAELKWYTGNSELHFHEIVGL